MLNKILLLVVATSVVSGKIHEKYVHINNEFTLDLLKELLKQNSTNFMYNGISLETILELTYLGAKGDTAAEMRKIMQLPESHEKVTEYVETLYSELDALEGPSILLANKIFLAKDIHPEPHFTKIAKEDFKAGVDNIDFSNRAEAAEKINSWVAEKTHNKIKNLVEDDEFSNVTKSILASTLYFKGNFEFPFDPKNTKKMDFHTEKNETVQVDMMQLSQHLHFHRNEEHDFTAIKIPFAGTKGKLNLVLVLTSDMYKLVFDSKKAAPKQRGKYTKKYVKLFLPKVKLENTVDFEPVLKDMGMTKLFSIPDLSGITKNAVEISDIFQKAVLEINEHGVDAAAAATRETTPVTSEHKKEEEEIHCNRPFLITVMYEEICLLFAVIRNPLDL